MSAVDDRRAAGGGTNVAPSPAAAGGPAPHVHRPTGVAFVTGATGFVGSHLVDALVEEGWRVRCLVRPTSRLRWLPRERVELATGSLDDRATLAPALAGVRVVFHAAGLTPAVAAAGFERVNVGGTQALLDAVRAGAGDALFVLLSSLAAAGPARDGRPLVESDSPRPIGAYGRSKLEAERRVTDSGLDHVMVRPPAVYGPRDADVLAAFRLARRGLALRVGPADQRLSLIHVRDLALGLLDAAERGAGRGTFYLTDGVVHTWREVTAAIAAAVGARVREVAVPLPLVRVAAAGAVSLSRMMGGRPLLTPERVRDLAQPDWTCDDSRARRELGYRTSLPLARGIVDTAEWYRANRWL